MKYLRLFEGFEEDGYEKISFNEWHDNAMYKVSMSLNNIRAFDKFFSIYPSEHNRSNGEYFTAVEFGEKRSASYFFVCDKFQVVIHECEDEYLYVVLTLDPFGHESVTGHYRCDQEHGVFKLVKDKVK
jgi:hypothetical protein